MTEEVFNKVVSEENQTKLYPLEEKILDTFIALQNALQSKSTEEKSVEGNVELVLGSFVVNFEKKEGFEYKEEAKVLLHNLYSLILERYRKTYLTEVQNVISNSSEKYKSLQIETVDGVDGLEKIPIHATILGEYLYSNSRVNFITFALKKVIFGEVSYPSESSDLAKFKVMIDNLAGHIEEFLKEKFFFSLCKHFSFMEVAILGTIAMKSIEKLKDKELDTDTFMKYRLNYNTALEMIEECEKAFKLKDFTVTTLSDYISGIEKDATSFEVEAAVIHADGKESVAIYRRTKEEGLEPLDTDEEFVPFLNPFYVTVLLLEDLFYKNRLSYHFDSDGINDKYKEMYEYLKSVDFKAGAESLKIKNICDPIWTKFDYSIL